MEAEVTESMGLYKNMKLINRPFYFIQRRKGLLVRRYQMLRAMTKHL